jgi:hypothetical protein
MAIARLLAKTFLDKRGREIFRDLKGHPISKAKFLELTTKGGLTLEQRMKKELEGAPPKGWTWARIVSKYPEKFEDYI